MLTRRVFTRFQVQGVWTGFLTLAASLLIALPFPQTASTASADGSVLPFPLLANKSIAKKTLAESTLVKQPAVSHLPKDAPNILIVLLDDVGFGISETFGGGVKTPALSKLAEEGIVYNQKGYPLSASTTTCSVLRWEFFPRFLAIYQGAISGKYV